MPSTWQHPKNDGSADIDYDFGLPDADRSALASTLNEACHVFRHHADGHWVSLYKDRYVRDLVAHISAHPGLPHRLLRSGDRRLGARNMLRDLTPPQRQLADFMSDLSENAYCAGWMSGLEYALWEWRHLTGGRNSPSAARRGRARRCPRGRRPLDRSASRSGRPVRITRRLDDTRRCCPMVTHARLSGRSRSVIVAG